MPMKISWPNLNCKLFISKELNIEIKVEVATLSFIPDHWNTGILLHKKVTCAKHFEPKSRCKTIASSVKKRHFCQVQNFWTKRRTRHLFVLTSNLTHSTLIRLIDHRVLRFKRFKDSHLKIDRDPVEFLRFPCTWAQFAVWTSAWPVGISRVVSCHI